MEFEFCSFLILMIMFYGFLQINLSKAVTTSVFFHNTEICTNMSCFLATNDAAADIAKMLITCPLCRCLWTRPGRGDWDEVWRLQGAAHRRRGLRSSDCCFSCSSRFKVPWGQWISVRQQSMPEWRDLLCHQQCLHLHVRCELHWNSMSRYVEIFYHFYRNYFFLSFYH